MCILMTIYLHSEKWFYNNSDNLYNISYIVWLNENLRKLLVFLHNFFLVKRKLKLKTRNYKV